MDKNKNLGFSLVELSVTLVIAGLLMAAITSGTHLMQAAKLNRIVSEMSGYVKAVNSFKDKYKSWPGDMPDATSYWGTYAAGPPISGATDGNGDEHISGNSTESIYAWRQMSLSGMIAGNYSGADAGTPDYQADINMPASTGAESGSIYFLTYYSSFFGASGNVLQLSGVMASNSPMGEALTPADAHIIDTKIDDGFASTGNVYSIRGDTYNGVSGRCVDDDYSVASANYLLTDATVSCRIAYWLNKM